MIVTDKDLEELRNFFEERAPLPKSIQLDAGSTIIDTAKFLESHFLVLESNRVPAFGAFYERLLRLKQIISDQKS